MKHKAEPWKIVYIVIALAIILWTDLGSTLPLLLLYRRWPWRYRRCQPGQRRDHQSINQHPHFVKRRRLRPRLRETLYKNKERRQRTVVYRKLDYVLRNGGRSDRRLCHIRLLWRRWLSWRLVQAWTRFRGKNNQLEYRTRSGADIKHPCREQNSWKRCSERLCIRQNRCTHFPYSPLHRSCSNNVYSHLLRQANTRQNRIVYPVRNPGCSDGPLSVYADFRNSNIFRTLPPLLQSWRHMGRRKRILSIHSAEIMNTTM